MALTDATIQAAFAEEAGDASSLAQAAEIRRWFNEGQTRLHRYVETTADISWASGDTTVALPSGFVELVKLDYDTGVVRQPFIVFGSNLILDRADGATAAGTGRIRYLAERAALAQDATSAGTDAEDYACLYYALHRFYRKLCSNRVQYKRYSTLLGANAVSVGDLQAEADRLYQDFIDARDDLPVKPPATFYTR